MMIRDCCRAVAEVFGVSLDLLRGPGHTKAAAQVRAAAIWLARQEGHTWGQIANFFSRDTKTVRHAFRRVMDWARRDPGYARKVVEAALLLARWVVLPPRVVARIAA